MTNSVSAGYYAEQAYKRMEVKDCPKAKDKKHKWKPQTPFCGMAQCEHCKKTEYTK